MTDIRPGKGATEEEILLLLPGILGRRAIDIDEEIAKKDEKNMMADVVEQGYFGVEKNSRQEADFPEAGIELKVTTLELKKSEPLVAPKERMYISSIDKEEVIEKQKWYNVKGLKKANDTLIVWYLNLEDDEDKYQPYIWSHLWKPEKNVIWKEKIQRDCEIIKEKIKSGEDLSAGDTEFLIASTKDTGHKDEHSRSWAIKAGGMRRILAYSTGLRLTAPGRIRSGGIHIDKLKNRIVKEKKSYNFKFDKFLSEEVN